MKQCTERIEHRAARHKLPGVGADLVSLQCVVFIVGTPASCETPGLCPFRDFGTFGNHLAFSGAPELEKHPSCPLSSPMALEKGSRWFRIPARPFLDGQRH